MQIIKVTCVFSCKLPNGEWLNLALIRRLQLELDPSPILVLTWENGDSQTYRGDKALAIVEAWEEAQTIDKSGEELGAIDAQLLAHGASPRLIDAVKTNDADLFLVEMERIESPEQRKRLARVIEPLRKVSHLRLFA
jgi:hypothetical protein